MPPALSKVNSWQHRSTHTHMQRREHLRLSQNCTQTDSLDKTQGRNNRLGTSGVPALRGKPNLTKEKLRLTHDCSVSGSAGPEIQCVLASSIVFVSVCARVHVGLCEWECETRYRAYPVGMRSHALRTIWFRRLEKQRSSACFGVTWSHHSSKTVRSNSDARCKSSPTSKHKLTSLRKSRFKTRLHLQAVHPTRI